MLEYIDLIIKLGALVATIIALWKSVKAIVKFADDFKTVKEYVLTNKDNVDSIPDIARHCKENYLTSLRLTIMNTEMPLGERIAAGHAYLSEDGNGDVKKYLIDELHINDTHI